MGFLDSTKEDFNNLSDSFGALKDELGIVSTAYGYDRVFTERWWVKWWKDNLLWFFAFVMKGALILLQ
jgi:hypothetical protein